MGEQVTLIEKKGDWRQGCDSIRHWGSNESASGHLAGPPHRGRYARGHLGWARGRSLWWESEPWKVNDLG